VFYNLLTIKVFIYYHLSTQKNIIFYIYSLNN